MRTATENSRDLQKADTPPPAGDTNAGGRRSPRRRFGLRNWRVPVRLVALIAIPTVVASILGGLSVWTDVETATDYGRIEKLARFSREVNKLVHFLEAERDVVAGNAAGRPPPFDQQAQSEGADELIRRVQTTVDSYAVRVRKQAEDIDDGFPQLIRDQVRDMLQRLNTLPALRQVAAESRLPVLSSVERYSTFIAGLLEINKQVAQGSTNANLAETASSLDALATMKEQVSKQRAILYAVLILGQFEQNELDAIRSAQAQEDSALQAFQARATADQRQLFNDTVTGDVVDQGELLLGQALSLADEDRVGLSVRPLAEAQAQKWFINMTQTLNQISKVEEALANEAINLAATERDNAQRSAIVDGAVILLVLVLVLASTIIVARSLVRPLRRLRLGALEVAGTRLPGLVRRLREPDAAETRLEVEPIDVDSTDEIGEVARAFDEVHREAVRLAANEALLRGNINAMFVNLSRRSQSLIERQLGLIDQLEQGEEDAERLSNLFKLDHLATRMRRNSENLLVLGGHEPARRWSEPVPLVDIVRASLSEIEQYERVTLRVQADVAIAGQAVSDIVHLAAELIENATVYSPQHTKVTVSGHLLSGGGAMLQITDNGVGMSAEELEDANWRLANPPVIDVSVSRRMGLFVVGRLASRHGVRVELRSALSGGLTAFVMLPAALVVTDASAAGGAGAASPQASVDPSLEASASHPESSFGSSISSPTMSNGNSGAGTYQATTPQPAVPQDAPQGTGMPQQSGGGTGSPLPRRDVGRSGLQPPRQAGDGAGAPPRREPAGVSGDGGGYDVNSYSTDSLTSQDGMVSQDSLTSQDGLQDGFYTGPQPSGPSVPAAPSEAQPGSGPLPRFQTGPFPQVGTGRQQSYQTGLQNTDSAASAGRRERLPIFDAVESEWFQRSQSTPVTRRATPTDSGASVSVPRPSESGAGQAPGQAAQAPGQAAQAPGQAAQAPGQGEGAQQPAHTSPPRWRSPGDEGWKAAELAARPQTADPTRAGLPRRVPGANLIPGSAGQSRAQTPAPTMSPDAVRSRLSGFQQGIRQGREAARSLDGNDDHKSGS